MRGLPAKLGDLPDFQVDIGICHKSSPLNGSRSRSLRRETSTESAHAGGSESERAGAAPQLSRGRSALWPETETILTGQIKFADVMRNGVNHKSDMTAVSDGEVCWETNAHVYLPCMQDWN